jgi:catechol 2,3-dioxygenase-like lactoylglutathione lyase family enzyme
MPVMKLDHVNIRTPRLAETIDFYRDVLGMEVTPSPAYPDMKLGAWIRDEAGAAVIHLVSTDAPFSTRLSDALHKNHGSGAIDHIALECAGYEEMVAKIEAFGLPFRSTGIASVNLRQLFVEDPNGILVELNFR